MAESAVRVIKFDIGSPTDKTLKNMQAKLHATSTVEAMRRSLAIADAITDFANKGKIFTKDEQGNEKEILIS